MQERPGIVTMKGNPLTLVGTELKVGDQAPAFVALDNDLSPVSLDSFRGKVCIISSEYLQYPLEATLRPAR